MGVPKGNIWEKEGKVPTHQSPPLLLGLYFTDMERILSGATVVAKSQAQLAWGGAPVDVILFEVNYPSE